MVSRCSAPSRAAGSVSSRARNAATPAVPWEKLGMRRGNPGSIGQSFGQYVFRANHANSTAEGAFTIVNGRRCAMREGDLVLTPPMCWHGHINESGRRTVWFDAANMPAICALDASFFEPGTRQDERFWEVSDAGSAEYRFPAAETRKELASTALGADGARTVRYTKNGGSVMPTLDLFLTRIEKQTRPKRGTYNAICLVVSGEGRSSVGDQQFEWSRHDVFTVPHWTWASHEARGAAELFIVTDRAIYERLDLLREELG